MDEESGTPISNRKLTKRKMDVSNDESVGGNIFQKRVRTLVLNEEIEVDTESTATIKSKGISNLQKFVEYKMGSYIFNPKF